jgi:two-component system CheB/CheR fusion protein
MSLDLVSCRNMLIYLKSDIERELTTLFHHAIRPGGYLFLGSAETVAGRPELFEALDRKQRIFQRRNIIVRAPAGLPLSRFRGHQPGVLRSASSESDLQKSLERLLLDQYLPAGAVVKVQGDIVYLFGLTGKYLEPSAGTPSLNLLSLARKELRLHLRTSLHRAATRKESVSDPGIVLQIDQQRQVIKLTVRPLTELGPDSGLYLVIFQEMALAEPESVPREEAKGDDTVVQRLHEELRTTRQQLQETIEELETANEELLSGNEELLSVNEELQSSNEELQSSKEEMQSLNAELSAKVEELEGTRNDLQNLFESTRIATVFLDKDLCIKRFTPVSTELFRLRESDLGRPITDIAARFIDGDISQSIREVVRTLQHKEVSIERAEGNRRYIMRIMPYRTRNNIIDGATLAFMDVTDLKRAEEAGRASEERFRTAVENLMDGFMISSAVRDDAGEIVDFRIEYVNEAACALNRRTRGQQIGQGLLESFPNLREVGLFDLYRRVADTGEPATREGFTFEIAGPPGRTYDMRITKLDDGFALAWRDVTVRHQALAAIQEADRRKDEFLAMLSHELRNPLAAIAASIHLWRRRGPEDPQLDRARDVAERQSRHMTRLLDDLLELARITRGQITLHRQHLDLREVAEAAVRAVTPSAEARQQQLSLSLPVEPVRVEGDPIRLAQAVGNLLNNAVKYTPPGGHIWLGIQRSDRQAIVRVRDDGIGIGPEIMPHIFDLFVQADPGAGRSQGGLGLGLTLVKRLVEMHGGSVEASSDGEGKGSEFVIQMPLLPETEINASMLAAEKPLAETPKRILIADDNADTAEMLAMLLQMDGHQVIAATNGQEAIAMAINHRPDVVLLDIGMPGMDGYEVAHRLRQYPVLSGKIIVALTGYGQREDQERSRRAGFDYHLVKPVDMEVLRRVLRGETHGIE